MPGDHPQRQEGYCPSPLGPIPVGPHTPSQCRVTHCPQPAQASSDLPASSLVLLPVPWLDT